MSGEPMPIKRVMQTRLNNCGQTCVAMIADWPVDHVEVVMGKRGLTNWPDLRRALHRLGWRATGCKRTKFFKLAIVKTPRMILRVQGEGRIGHFVVKDGFKVLDPSPLEPEPIHWSKFLAKIEAMGWRPTSYIEFARMRG